MTPMINLHDIDVTKFLVDREGKVIARFEPTVDMKEVRDAVSAAL